MSVAFELVCVYGFPGTPVGSPRLVRNLGILIFLFPPFSWAKAGVACSRRCREACIACRDGVAMLRAISSNCGSLQLEIVSCDARKLLPLISFNHLAHFWRPLVHRWCTGEQCDDCSASSDCSYSLSESVPFCFSSQWFTSGDPGCTAGAVSALPLLSCCLTLLPV